MFEIKYHNSAFYPYCEIINNKTVIHQTHNLLDSSTLIIIIRYCRSIYGIFFAYKMAEYLYAITKCNLMTANTILKYLNYYYNNNNIGAFRDCTVKELDCIIKEFVKLNQLNML